MTKRKILLTALCVTSVTACVAGFAACGGTPHEHAWSDWTVTQAPTDTEEGKATRTCSNDGCDASDTDKEYTLPALTSTDYEKTETDATCTVQGKITYAYDKDGVSVSFDVATAIDPDAHDYTEYRYTAAGHYMVCSYDDTHTTALEAHDTDGENGACSVCGYVSGEVGTDPHVHTHNWTAWSVTDENLPTDTEEGKATRTCLNDDCDATDADKEHVIPALTDEGYTLTNDTATIDAAGTGTYTYTDGDFTVSFTAATPQLEGQSYTVTVENAGAGVTVKLGSYSAQTNEDGVAVVRAEKKDYTVVVENTVEAGGKNRTYAYNAAEITAENPRATVTGGLPAYLEASPVTGTYYNATAEITEDGLYFFDVEYYTPTFICITNNSGTTQKYTVTILDTVSEYTGEDYEFTSEPFDVYIMQHEEGKVLTVDMCSNSVSGGVAVIQVVSTEYEDGTVHTPIPVALGDAVTLSESPLYYRLVPEENSLVSFETEGTVVWYGTNLGGEGTDLPESIFLDHNNSYYFLASGEGTFTATKEVVAGENRENAIALTKNQNTESELGVLGGVMDYVRWFKFEGENTNTGYLTLVATAKVTFTVYEGGTQIAEEYNLTVLPVAVQSGSTYYVKVEYYGDFEDSRATIGLLYRDYEDADALAEDYGQNQDDPYVLTLAEQDETYENRAHGEVTFEWGSQTNQYRYLLFTAEGAGELVFTAPSSSFCALYSDAEYTTAFESSKYSSVNSANGEIFTISLEEDETVYVKLSYITQKGMTATVTFTLSTPVNYTVVVKDSLGNAVEGISVSLYDGETAVGTLSTNENGEAVFTNVNPAAYTVKIDSEDYAYEREVTTENSMVDCTTEVSVTEYVQYTITLTADGEEALSGLTVTLKDTNATGTTDEHGTVTFEQKVKRGEYTVEVEGYIVTGKTTAQSTSVTVTVTPASSVNGVNKVTAIKAAEAVAEGEGAELAIGENEVIPLSTADGFTWFKAAADGSYTFTVTDDALYIYSFRLKKVGASGATILYSAKVNALEANNATYETKDGTDQIYTITIALSEGEVVLLTSGSRTETTHITVSQA